MFSHSNRRAVRVPMEFELACIYRMNKILSDLSSNVQLAIKNVHYNKNTRFTSCSEIPVAANGFIDYLKMFNELVDSRMNMKIIEKMERDYYLRDSIANLKGAREDVEALKFELEEGRSRHSHVVQMISDEISEKNSLLEKIKNIHATKISERIKESETDIARIKEVSGLKIKILEEEIDASKRRLEDSCGKNLSHERELSGKRSKVERQYLAVLAKYDTEVGELYRSMENLTEELSCLDKRLVDLQNQLEIQEIQYVELKNEREMTILKAFTEDLEHFVKNRAAKIIQRAWRNFYERCCMKKKKKSKKKK